MLVAWAVIIQLLLDPLLAGHAPLLLFTFSVVLVAWRGGFGPVLAASALSILAAGFFISEPRLVFKLPTSAEATADVLFLAFGVLVGLLSKRRKQAERRSFELLSTEREARREAEHVNQLYSDLMNRERAARGEAEQAKLSLREARDELEIRVQERTAELSEANKALRVQIEERARAEELLRISQSRLAGILDNADDAIISVDSNHQITLFNHGAERVFGYMADAIAGQPLDLLALPSDRETQRRLIAEFADSPEMSRRMGQQCAVTLRRKDGRDFPAEASISKLELAGETILTVILRDVTDRKALEDQLRQSQKMEAVGRLAGGIAHDFNNLLTAIIGYSQLSLSRLRPGDSLRLALSEIEKAGQRAASLTSQLLAFSRQQILQPKVIDLNEIVVDISKLIRRLISEDIDLATALKPGIGPILADPGQIEQVIMNVALNARDAMPQGGKLTIETANMELDEAYALQHALVKRGTYTMLAISDTGGGMDEETKAQIFEPFFTTKEAGKGTGLGLSTVYGIVKQSDGHIWVYSEVGRGTTVKIYFPHIEGEAEPLSKGAVKEVLPRGSETILLVEDEEAVRKLIREVLEMNGYSVLEVAKAEDALTAANDPDKKIDLLLTDVVMPDMSGKALANLIGVIRPEIKVLYISGYTDNTIVHHGILDPGIAFLQKPFTPDALVRKVREVLDAPNRDSDMDGST